MGSRVYLDAELAYKELKISDDRQNPEYKRVEFLNASEVRRYSIRPSTLSKLQKRYKNLTEKLIRRYGKHMGTFSNIVIIDNFSQLDEALSRLGVE